MMQGAQASILPDGRRLHLHHGPIDLIVEVFGAHRNAAYARLQDHFAPLLGQLVPYLPDLRRADADLSAASHPVVRRMAQAVAPFEQFITPMAAVAGAVADEMLAQIASDPLIPRAYVNNGGDVAFHLVEGHSLTAAAPGFGPIAINAQDTVRGMATSGWGGRSHSFGIADSVTVLAPCAAMADAAATLIANAVDLPDHPDILRQPACQLAPDSDLGDRLVTVGVPLLSRSDANMALDRGLAVAKDFLHRNLIAAAGLTLQRQTRLCDPTRALTHSKEPTDA